MQRGLMLAAIALALLGAGASRASDGYGLAQQCDSAPPCFSLASTIAFTSTPDDPIANPQLAAEIYLINPDGTDARRLTENTAGDGFPALSPDGKKIVQATP